MSLFGPVLYEMYGASELGTVAIMEPTNMLTRTSSCGKAAPGVEAALVVLT